MLLPVTLLPVTHMSESSHWHVCSLLHFSPLQLCGGTHLGSTAEAGSFYIVEESAISAGTRRIIAVTLNAAEAAANRAAELQTEVETANSKSGDELKADINRITGLVNESLIPAVAKANLRAKIKALDQRHRAESKVGRGPCVWRPCSVVMRCSFIALLVWW